MKVKELLRWTEWRPGSDYNNPTAPTLSILLPTFRRGSDGLFLRVARSILAQSLKSIELIIIDDASTDGTAELIAKLMAEDGRVSCLTHKVNLGLPAISEYEAFMKSRGEFIGFAFDDFLFELGSFECMIEQMKARNLDAAYGNVSLLLDADTEIPLGETIGLDRLAQDNFIGNSSVVLRRDVVERVGFYDPHVALSRVCDWDLWRRVVRKTALTQLNVTVGRELGASRSDSLGNTYPMHPEAIQEFFAEERDALLTPENFAERDIFALPASSSVPLQQHIKASSEFFASKAWFGKTGQIEIHDQRKVVSIFNDLSMRSQFAWGAIPNSTEFHVNWVANHRGTFYLDSLLVRSDAVVFQGDLSDPSTFEALHFCKRHGIPAVYYVDERSPLIQRASRLNSLRQAGLLRKALSLKRKKRSNLEELRHDIVVKGWAFESDKLHSWLEIAVDGVLVGYVEATLDRPDLKDAGFGTGKHGFNFLLPRSVFDGNFHEVSVRWADDKAHITNSPMRFLLPRASDIESQRQSIEAEYSSSSALDMSSVKDVLSPFHAVVASSEPVRKALVQESPNERVFVSRPSFCPTRLNRQRGIRNSSLGNASEALRIAVFSSDAEYNFDGSSLHAGLRLVNRECRLRFEHPIGNLDVGHTVVEPVTLTDFGTYSDEWTRWLPDLAILPAGATALGDRVDDLILQCLYIGAVPVVADTPCFDGWDPSTGVRRVADSPRAWASAVDELANSTQRSEMIARLEAACRERFTFEQQETLLRAVMNGIQPVSLLSLSERYRSAWKERASR